MMDFAELDMINELLQTNNGSTDVDINIYITLAQKNSDVSFDLFILETPDQIKCYKEAIINQDWTYSCTFLSLANQTFLNIVDKSINL